ncbi:MAG TPA: HPF/RaiA family ribosome-associated protein [Candidatus Udaeobacter sp.]|nr:HPF/RaiA family ribosome-associated protein [Candidatus Udaeobacter sp.]
MDVVIRNRTDHLPAELRDYVEKKVKRLGDHLDLVSSVDVEFDRDVRKRPTPLHAVKITLHLLARRTPDFRVRETGRYQRANFDVAMARMEAEAAHLKERIKAHP